MKTLGLIILGLLSPIFFMLFLGYIFLPFEISWILANLHVINIPGDIGLTPQDTIAGLVTVYLFFVWLGLHGILFKILGD